jgi:hypothetical protein
MRPTSNLDIRSKIAPKLSNLPDEIKTPIIRAKANARALWATLAAPPYFPSVVLFATGTMLSCSLVITSRENAPLSTGSSAELSAGQILLLSASLGMALYGAYHSVKGHMRIVEADDARWAKLDSAL